MGQRRSALRQCRHLARQILRQDGGRRFRKSAGRASHRHLLLLQGGVGRHARAQLRPHRAHHLVVGPVRQFRPGQLRRGEIRHGRADERAGGGGPQEQHPRQHDLADRGDPHDRRIAAAAGARADEARGDHAGGAVSARRGRADPHHHGRRRGLVCGDQDHGDRRHQSGRSPTGRRTRSPRISPRSATCRRRGRCRARSSRRRNMSRRLRRGRGSSSEATPSTSCREERAKRASRMPRGLRPILRDASQIARSSG